MVNNTLLILIGVLWTRHHLQRVIQAIDNGIPQHPQHLRQTLSVTANRPTIPLIKAKTASFNAPPHPRHLHQTLAAMTSRPTIPTFTAQPRPQQHLPQPNPSTSRSISTPLQRHLPPDRLQRLAASASRVSHPSTTNSGPTC